MLGILDYNAGNQTSVQRALTALDIPSTITSDPSQLERCIGIIFPGVGAAGSAMQELTRRGLDRFLSQAKDKGQPILGICLGCQILLTHSEENDSDLLNLCPGQCKRFPEDGREENGQAAPIPHMGWNTIEPRRDSCLFQKIPYNAFFYFVHSYYVLPEPASVLAETSYSLRFCSVHGRDGLWGVQFHPEKSGTPGLQLLRNFYDYALGSHYAQ